MHEEKKSAPDHQKKSSQDKELKIDSPDSVHEKEADDIAMKVINGDQLAGEKNAPNGQIMGGGGKNSDMISMKGGGEMQNEMVASEEVRESIEATRGHGEKLPEGAKRFVKNKNSSALEEVNIHTGSHAAEMSKALNAKAFTYGNDIYFDQGKFDLYSSEGKQLLAHELAHTQQQINDQPVLQRSAYGTKDVKNKTVTLCSNMIYYGYDATETIAAAASKEIEDMWNAANGTSKFGSDVYDVDFKISHEVVTIAKAMQMASSNSDVKNNFVRIERDNIEDRSFYRGYGSNAGHFITSDNLGSSTTAAHEYGHGLGLPHPAGNMIGKGQPGIMAARGTGVDAAYTYTPSKGDSKLNNQGTAYDNSVDPKKRKVTQGNINDLGLGTKLATGSGNVGTAFNWLHDAMGNIASSWVALHANPWAEVEQEKDTTKDFAPRDNTYVAPPVIKPMNR